jgi:hypothetical protein
MPAEPRKTRTCLSFTPKQIAELRSLSRETGAPIAELARRAVDAFLLARLGDRRGNSDRPAINRVEPERSITTVSRGFDWGEPPEAAGSSVGRREHPGADIDIRRGAEAGDPCEPVTRPGPTAPTS